MKNNQILVKCIKDCTLPPFAEKKNPDYSFNLDYEEGEQYECYGDNTYKRHIDVKDKNGIIHSFVPKSFKEHFKLLDINQESEVWVNVDNILLNTMDIEGSESEDGEDCSIYQLQYFGHFTNEDKVDETAHTYVGSFTVIKEGTYQECLDKLNFDISDLSGVPEHQIVQVKTSNLII